MLGAATLLPFASAESSVTRFAAQGGEDAIRLFHGTSSSRASGIVANGFRPGADGAVFFAKESNTAFHFARASAAVTGARSVTAIEFTMPRSLAQDFGLLDRQLIGEFRGLPWVDVPGGTGFERIMTGNKIDAFNQALQNRSIAVRRLRGGF